MTGQEYLDSLTPAEYLQFVRQVEGDRKRQWRDLLERYNQKDLYKNDVIELLRSGSPPTAEALDMIADILANEGKPLRSDGRRDKTLLVNGHYVAAAPYVCGFIDAAVYDGGLGLQEAKQLACDRFGVGMRSVENWRKDTQ